MISNTLVTKTWGRAIRRRNTLLVKYFIDIVYYFNTKLELCIVKTDQEFLTAEAVSYW